MEVLQSDNSRFEIMHSLTVKSDDKMPEERKVFTNVQITLMLKLGQIHMILFTFLQDWENPQDVIEMWKAVVL